MSQNRHILLVEDDTELCDLFKNELKTDGYHVISANNCLRAKEAVELGKFDIAILDIRLPDGSGTELLKSFKDSAPDMGTILITGYSEINSAVEAIELGADDFLKKPFDPGELLVRIRELSKKRHLRQDHEKLEKTVRTKKNKQGLIGECDSIHRIRETAALLGNSDSTVLITGESGSGKEVLANMLHQSGNRAKKPFVSINCGAIPEELLESELFGHVKGAFTGAVRTRPGRFEVANGGTIFLDEIGDMSPMLQVKLLRVLQERCFEPVGTYQSTHIDVRVIAATHRDLEEEISAGRFREDLFYRLNVIPLELPPLRERGDDTLLLAEFFIERFNKSRHANIRGFNREARKAMLNYTWPGNVRELQNLIERIATLKRSGEVQAEDLPSKMFTQSDRIVQEFSSIDGDEPIQLKDMVDEFERHLIVSALDRFDWNKNRAASFLSMNRTTLVEKIKKKGLIRETAQGLLSN
ncbi:MAG: sigma-54 dependent transcriptional regulator [Mariprofundaceae bacterium]